VVEVTTNNVNQPEDEKMEADSPTKTEEAEEKPPTEPKEDEKSENESKDAEKQSPVVTPPAPGPSNSLTSTRNDLIKDIESHIEIIYECLDELNETGASSSLNKTSSSDVITISSETSSQDVEKTVNEVADDGGSSGKDPPAQEESKPE
jgi:ubiquitin carboxyl-terminal hydrolase 34